MDDLLYYLREPLWLVISLVVTVVCIACLVNAAKTGRWLFFVIILFFWPAALVYLFTAYRTPKQLREVARRRRRAAGRRVAARDREIAELKQQVERLETPGTNPEAGGRG
jgi:hypothetical protein